MERIYVSGPSITEKEISYVTDAARNAWYENANVYNERFEKAFADYIGTRYAVSLPSCTSAIHLALLALNIGPGDEVIVPDITWIATAAPITYVGATPIFVDVDQKSWCIDVESFKNAITERTKAVIPVDLYGGMPEMDKIIEIARKHGIAIIEDAAEAIGSEYHGQKAGSFGDVGVFSFHGSKTMTTGEGGMLVTDNQDLYDQCLVMRDHGRSRCGKMFWNDQVAYKYKMSSMQAALGLAQLERVNELVEKKRQIFDWYESELSNSSFELNYEEAHVKNSYWMVTVIWPNLQDKMPKESVIEKMATYNISTRPFFYPLSSLPAYAHLVHQVKIAKENNIVSYAISPYGINLPCGMDMTKEKVVYVCESLKKVFEDY